MDYLATSHTLFIVIYFRHHQIHRSAQQRVHYWWRQKVGQKSKNRSCFAWRNKNQWGYGQTEMTVGFSTLNRCRTISERRADCSWRVQPRGGRNPKIGDVLPCGQATSGDMNNRDDSWIQRIK